MVARKQKQNVIVQEVEREVLVYDLDRYHAHALNETMAYVWRRSDGQTSPAEIAHGLGQRFQLPNSLELVTLAYQQLDKAGIVEPLPNPPADHFSRRELARRLQLTGALIALMPAITSIVAPLPAAAASTNCAHVGQACTDTPCCESGSLVVVCVDGGVVGKICVAAG